MTRPDFAPVSTWRVILGAVGYALGGTAVALTAIASLYGFAILGFVLEGGL